MFETTRDFLANFNLVFELKKVFYMTNMAQHTARKNFLFGGNHTGGSTGGAQNSDFSKKIAFDILNSQKQQRRNEWQNRVEVYTNLLVQINQHLTCLLQRYEEISLLNDAQNNSFTLFELSEDPFNPEVSTNTHHLKTQNENVELANKIHLWRLLYKTVCNICF
eukprot:GEZU01000717.1.p1 GENE.GEZU01000717.1~~GEZU01000717.1.p1  ORF type:complete len:183 (+),score=54.24 GEZU01000717.1:60-551(+)